MTIAEFMYSSAYKRIRRNVPLHEIDIILASVLKASREFLYSHPEYSLTKAQVTKLTAQLTRRQAGEPIAYITGTKEFYGLDFIVTPAVLIPRPDTELLVESILKYVKNSSRDARSRVSTATPIIADIGTGSGNIAIAVKHELQNHCSMIASDISATALHIAKKNAVHNKTAIEFYRSDVLQNIPKKYNGKIDVLICNAPYLTKTEARKKNLAFEPQVALTPTGSPTSIIEQLLQQAPVYLKPGGVLFLEMGHRQAKQVSALCKKYFPNSKTTTYKDLGNFDRVVVCKT